MVWWLQGVLIGVVATLVMDAWAIIAKRALQWPTGDWGHVGRWFGYMARGRFVHHPISASAPVRGERAIGWAAHYAIGIVYGVAYLLFAGWLDVTPRSLLSALVFALLLLVFPWLVMQPALGAGAFSSRAPNPALRRLVSVSMHTAFGAGLYIGVRFTAAT